MLPTLRHERLLDGLVELFLAEGFRGFRVADLAARMRCSKSTLYALGDSKERVTVTVVQRFFQTATRFVEGRTAQHPPGPERVAAYLAAVADALRPASARFMEDLAEDPATRRIYERNTAHAASRVRELIAEGVASGQFRTVHAEFVADTAAATMARIQRGEVRHHTGLRDADAYEELTALLLGGIRSPD
ncbi:MAG: TetR/AcrR family transcriptional regulator [Solirubrobacteraceae bacterium]|nr:TetR/AcrR family transcriptional regulator [Solirubrobacteraceae bacterium]